ncbi:MAG: ATP-binding protein [Gaiellaceae bacterium]
MNDDGNPEVVSLLIPAKPEYIVLGRLALTGILRPLDVEAEIVADAKLALTEACSNSIRHAYGDGGGAGAVEIRYELGDGKLSVEVSDEGGGFDPSALGAEGDELDEGGLGIAIIRAVTDELEIGPRTAGPGSCLRFIKYLG